MAAVFGAFLACGILLVNIEHVEFVLGDLDNIAANCYYGILVSGYEFLLKTDKMGCASFFGVSGPIYVWI